MKVILLIFLSLVLILGLITILILTFKSEKTPKKKEMQPDMPLTNLGNLCHFNSLIHLLVPLRNKGLFTPEFERVLNYIDTGDPAFKKEAEIFFLSLHTFFKGVQRDPRDDMEDLEKLNILNLKNFIRVKQYFVEPSDPRCFDLSENNIEDNVSYIMLPIHPQMDTTVQKAYQEYENELIEKPVEKPYTCTLHHEILKIIANKYLILIPSRTDPLDPEKRKIKTRISLEPLEIPKIGKFSLAGAVIHFGDTINSGHYISVAKKGDEWYLYDDERIADLGYQYNIDFKHSSLETDCTVLLYKLQN